MFLVSLSNYPNFFIILVLSSLTITLYFLFLYYWKIKNPYFIIFNYGSSICSILSYLDIYTWGIFYSDLQLYFIIIPAQIFFAFIIIYFIYLLTQLKTIGVTSLAEKVFVKKYGGMQAFGKERLDQFWHDTAVDIVSPNNSGKPKEEIIKVKEELKKKHKLNLIILLTIILTISFLSVYFYELTLY